MDALYLGNDKVLNRLFTGQFMFTSANDITVTPCIAFNSKWESGCTKAFLNILKDDSVVFDLGANFGYYSVIALSKVKSGAVYAFEPQPKVYELLCDTLYMNRKKNKVKAECKAVSSFNGDIRFYPHDKFTANASIYSEHKQNEYASKPIAVECVTLDSYCKVNNIVKVDVIKIDTEGNEPHVYDGMTNVIKNNNVTLLMEFCDKMYVNAEEFFNRILSDFEYIYVVRVNSLERVIDYVDFKQKVPDGYCMLMINKEQL